MRGRFDGCRRQETRDGLLNQAAATRYLGTDDPVGSFGRLGTSGTRLQVVGVVGDVKNSALGDATVPEVYVSSAVDVANPARFVVRSTLRADALLPGIRRAIHDVDPTLPIHSVTTVEEVMKGSLAAERVSAGLSGGFALTALLMAMLGIYGVVSYAVRQRTVEIGTRRAIGASGGDILRLVVGNGLTLAVVGMVLGGRRARCVAVIARARAADVQQASLFGSAAVMAWSRPADRRARVARHRCRRISRCATKRRDLGHRSRRNAPRDGRARRIPFTRAAAVNVDRAARRVRRRCKARRIPCRAMQQALDMVREQIGASSVVLLEIERRRLRAPPRVHCPLNLRPVFSMRAGYRDGSPTVRRSPSRRGTWTPRFNGARCTIPQCATRSPRSRPLRCEWRSRSGRERM
jgi:hypothetical protein